MYVNEEDPLKRRLVEDTITSLVADANKRISRQFTKVAVSYLDLLLNGGKLSLIGQNFDVLGLQKLEQIARDAHARLPAGSRLALIWRGWSGSRSSVSRASISPTTSSARSASRSVVSTQVPSGKTVPLTTFAAAVAVRCH